MDGAEPERAEPTVAATVAAARAATARAKMVMAATARTPTPVAATATAAARSTEPAKSLLALSGFRRVAAFVSAMRVPKDEASTQSIATITSKPRRRMRIVYAAQKWLANAEDAANTDDDLNEVDLSIYLNEREPTSPWKQRAGSQDKPTAGVHFDSASAAEVARCELAARRIQYAMASHVKRSYLLSAAAAQVAAAEARAVRAEACSGRLEPRLAERTEHTRHPPFRSTL